MAATEFDREEMFWERVDILYDAVQWRTWSVAARLCSPINCRPARRGLAAGLLNSSLG